jgi:uncharacterized membrane protein YjjP (DUF1212 family)
MMVIVGSSSLFFKWAFHGNWYILLATLLASGIGVIIKPKAQSSKLKGEVL